MLYTQAEPLTALLPTVPGIPVGDTARRTYSKWRPSAGNDILAFSLP